MGGLKVTFEQTITIAIITAVFTLVANTLLQTFIKHLDENFESKKFKRNRAMERLDNLYFELYNGVIQSEYFRHFLKKTNNMKDYDFYNYPFFEIGRELRTEKYSLDGDSVVSITELVDDITEEKKIYLAVLITKNPKYASDNLLKIAKAYRFVHSNYLKKLEDKVLLELFQEEEIRLLRLMVSTIIKERNELTDLCGLSYNGREWNYGKFDSSIFDKDQI